MGIADQFKAKAQALKERAAASKGDGSRDDMSDRDRESRDETEDRTRDAKLSRDDIENRFDA